MFISVTLWERHRNCQTVAILSEKVEEIVSTNLLGGRYTGSFGVQPSLKLPLRRILEVRVGLRYCREDFQHSYSDLTGNSTSRVDSYLPVS